MSNTVWNASGKPSIHSLAMCVLTASALVGTGVLGQSRPAGQSPRTTRDRLSEQHWWPTKGTLPLQAFAGESACSKCHPQKTSSQIHTPMAEAAIRLDKNTTYSELAASTLQIGTYLYQISSDQRGSKLAVSSGKRSVTANIAWIFGAGVHGQTYILENDGSLYESQVSSFAGLHGMDLTPGHLQVEPDNLKNALGERLSTSTATRCFGCHTTYSSANSNFDPSHATPGVHCEACHGPGLEHVHAAQLDQLDGASAYIFNPANLSPVESVDFCGACHRASMDVIITDEAYGPINVRFQPYRLEKSRCWGTQGDDRLTCIACHDPHQPLVRGASFYDQRCLKCHVGRTTESSGVRSSLSVCPRATTNCTSCHMPKSYVPEMHANFTDHFIRIVRDGESYPN
jgi:hypothetical protein